MDELGDRVRQARERKGMTQGELARASGLSPGAVSRIEHGERTPGAETVRVLAQALGLEPGELLGGARPVSLQIVPAPVAQPAQPAHPEANGRVLEAIQLVASIMPTLPVGGQARVLRIIEAALRP